MSVGGDFFEDVTKMEPHVVMAAVVEGWEGRVWVEWTMNLGFFLGFWPGGGGLSGNVRVEEN